MIEIRHLKKAFANSTPIKDISAVINNGDVVSIIGPSGTGKSTLIRCINMLNIPTSGQVLIDGVDLMNPGTDINKCRQKVGMVFQSYNLYEHLTVIENIMLAQTVLLGKSGQQAYDKGMELLRKVNLEDKALQYPKQLSGGQKQRVAIARTLAVDPEIILFDEPTAALDPLSVGDVEDLIASLTDGKRILMIVTHSMAFAEKVSTRVFYLDQGTIYEEGSPDQIFHHPQKERTRQFIFLDNNLKFSFNRDTFDLEKYIDQITKFCERHMFSAVRFRRIEHVFEELFANELLENGQIMSEIEVLLNYNPENMEISLSCNFQDPSSAWKPDDDSLSMMIIKSYTKEWTISNDSGIVSVNLKM